MNIVRANPFTYALSDELARMGLQATEHEAERKLAWVNSICLLFLIIGVVGSKPAVLAIKPLPRPEETVAVVAEPLPLPQPETREQNQEPNDQQTADTPRVVVVVPNAPAVNFAVPTIGNLLAPSSMAQAPPLNPLHPIQALEPIQKRAVPIVATGSGGERPQPPYPKIALDQGEQGTVVLTLTVDEGGSITSVEIKQSSGYPVLDRSALEFVKRHWTVPAGSGARLFEATIIYQLQAG